MQANKLPSQNENVAAAFSKQSAHFDEDDQANPVLQEWRTQVYDHIETFLKPESKILELNAGTGIDAIHFAKKGHRVHATDLSEGMIRQLSQKIRDHKISGVTWQQVSFTHLEEVSLTEFDYVFSDFGGLNCVADLSQVTTHLSEKIKAAGYVSWVIMPPFCPWECLWLFKGQVRKAFRRFKKNGTLAHLEGKYFKTYYHSVSDIQKALGESFKLIRAEGLGVFKAPPASTRFYQNHPYLYNLLKRIDGFFKDHFPFNRWGDHVIVTFRHIEK